MRDRLPHIERITINGVVREAATVGGGGQAAEGDDANANGG
nr:hypothetical protein [Streptomyces antimycoticus]